MAKTEGETQIISLTLPAPISESLSILVSFESLTGIWVRDCTDKAEIQWPNFDKLPLMHFNSWIRISFSIEGKS